MSNDSFRGSNRILPLVQEAHGEDVHGEDLGQEDGRWAGLGPDGLQGGGNSEAGDPVTRESICAPSPLTTITKS